MGRPEMKICSEQSEPVEVNRFIFLLMPGFSVLDLGSGLESLAAANEKLGRAFFQWNTVSETGGSVTSSSGLSVVVDSALPDLRRGDCVVICSAFNTQEYPKSGRSAAWLRQSARRGTLLCGLGGGALFLARIGIASEGRISTHWRLKPIFQENYEQLDPACTIFEETGNLVSCGGGAATLDLFSSLISQKAGFEISSQVADHLLCASVRDGNSRQIVASFRHAEYRNEKLSKAIAYMQECLEDPVSPTVVAEQVGMSTRQLERLCKKHLGTTPKSYMMNLRLDKARALLQQTDMRVIDVATACGFSSVSVFGKHYKRRFDISPRSETTVLAH
jgi:transcriptional regulator GlxA family with amidase domain